MRTPTGNKGSAVLDGESALDSLIAAVSELSHVDRIEDVQRIVRSTARRLVKADGATFVLRDNGQCFYADEDAISPLWKGQRFPLEACISGWSMIHREAVAIPDIYADERIPHDAYRPTFVKSLVMVPIRTGDPIGAIGMYWADQHEATEREIGLASALADSTAIALEHVSTREQLERTTEISETDSLTGLANRRAWDTALEQELGSGRAPLSVALLDLDDFKGKNDRDGHQAGDELLRSAGEAWTGALRGGDLVARLGGDEFGVLMPGCRKMVAVTIAERLREVTPGCHASIGVAEWNGAESAEDLIRRVDAALYEAKRAGGDHVAVAG